MIIVVVGIIVVVVVDGGGGGGGDADEWISSEESGCGDLEDFGALEKSFGLALAKQTKTHKLIIRIYFLLFFIFLFFLNSSNIFF